ISAELEFISAMLTSPQSAEAFPAAPIASANPIASMLSFIVPLLYLRDFLMVAPNCRSLAELALSRHQRVQVELLLRCRSAICFFLADYLWPQPTKLGPSIISLD